MQNLCRADDSDTERQTEIENNGFTLRDELAEEFGLAYVRELIQLFSRAMTLDGASHYFRDLVARAVIKWPTEDWDLLLGPQDVSELIIRCGGRSGPYISTDADPDCGGYSNGRFVWEIEGGQLEYQ